MFNANAYVIEVHGIAAGLLVRGERGRPFRFVAEDPRFSVFNGSRFSTPLAAQESASRHYEALEARERPSGAPAGHRRG
jgi:hypothetical protein